MACNRCSKLSEKEAAKLGAPALEAAWAAGRNGRGVRLCAVCRNCFLAADGSCAKCAKGLTARAEQNPARFMPAFVARRYPEWAMKLLAPAMARSGEVEAQLTAVPYLADRQLLDDLARVPNPDLQAAVAANPNASPESLAVLIESKNPRVFNAAVANPALDYEALARQAEQAEAKWLEVARSVSMLLMQNMIFGGQRGGGTLVMPLVILGIYGKPAFESFRRHRTLQNALNSHQGRTILASSDTDGQATPERKGQDGARPKGRAGAATAGSAHPPAFAPPPRPDTRLTNDEWQLLRRELRTAESGLEMSPGYYDDRVTLEQVVRIQNQGIQTDAEAEAAGFLLGQMAETAQNFTDWYGDDVDEKTFARMQDKLRCPSCGQFAGAAAHQCRPRPAAAAPAPTDAKSKPGEAVQVYQTASDDDPRVQAAAAALQVHLAQLPPNWRQQSPQPGCARLDRLADIFNLDGHFLVDGGALFFETGGRRHTVKAEQNIPAMLAQIAQG